MRAQTEGRSLKEDYRRRALKTLRAVIDAARRVAGAADEEKRAFVARDVSDREVSEAAEARLKDEHLGAAEKSEIQRLASFLTFAHKDGSDDSAWASIEARLSEGKPCSARTLELVAHLLDVKPDVDEMTYVISAKGTASDQQVATGSLLVYWHETIDDHRQVILGQLPQPGLYPAVFVFSADQGLWYPQHDLLRMKKQGGTAFVCNARFGNPRGIAHQASDGANPFPWHGTIRVYALRSEPDKKKIPPVLTDEQLQEWVAAHDQFGKAEEQAVIRDDPPILSILVEGRKEWTIRPLECHTCSFPVDLTWRTRRRISFEVRKVPTDEVVDEGAVQQGGRMRIVDKASPKSVPAGITKVGVPGEGIYRLRYWSVRKPFLDQQQDLWLEIKPAAPKRPTNAGATRR